MAAEKIFEKQVKQFLQENGIVELGTPEEKLPAKVNGWFVKIWGGGRNSGGQQRAGVPDIIGAVQGRSFALELKSETGKVSALQLKNMLIMNSSCPHGAWLLRPSKFEVFKEWIDRVLH